MVRACPRMSVGYAEVFPIRGQASAYRTTLLGIPWLTKRQQGRLHPNAMGASTA